MTGPFKVAVLEGDFAAICDLGLPISLSLQIHSYDLKLSEAKWAATSSSSGFSVSLYWPSAVMTEKVKPKRKRRRRKHPKASITNTVTDVATSPVSASEFNGYSDVTPNKAQSNKDDNQDSKPQTPVASSLVLSREASPTIHETSPQVSLDQTLSWKLTFCHVIMLAI